MSLSVKKIARIKAPGRYPDGDRLYLRVKPSGAASWLLRYEIGGRERFMGLGSLKNNTLKEARDKADAAAKLLEDGIDPLTARDEKRAQQAAEAAKMKTFEVAAQEYFDSHQRQWTNANYRGKFLSSLRMYAFPKIGKLPVSQIDTAAVLRVIDPIWNTKPDTANRVRQRIENILDWAAVRGYRTGDNPARWRGHIEEALPEKVASNKHYVALPYAEVPDFVAKLAEHRGIAPRAFEFLILTAARSGEVIGARWDEIDLEKKLWTIPEERMKERRLHRVPLADRAVAILTELPREGDFVFIGARKGQPIGKNSFLKLLRVKGHAGVTTHGFRSSFRDWCGETTSYPADICEVALSHLVSTKVQTAYQRGDLLEKRRKLMAEWAAFCTTPVKRSATVSPIRKQRGAQ